MIDGIPAPGPSFFFTQRALLVPRPIFDDIENVQTEGDVELS